MKRLIIIILILSAAAVFTFEAHGQESRHEQRRREKEQRTKEYCMFMDSLIRTHIYTFRPQSFQMQPAGKTQQIYNNNFRVDVRDEYIDIYLPFYRGVFPPYRISTINYTLPYVPEYTARQSDDGEEWTITFSTNLFSSDTFNFKFTVTTCTGSTELEITSNNNHTVTYSGYLSQVY